MLGLVHHLGVGGLQNDRVAQLVGRLKRVGDVPDHVARRDRDTAVAEEQRGVLDVQPAAFGVITDEPRGGRLRGREIDVHEPWHRTFRLSPPARVLRGSAHGTYRGFGEVEAGKCRIARRLGSSGPENDERGGDGMSRKRLLRRFCCGGCATDPRFDEYDDQRVQLAASGHDLDGPTQHFGRGCRAQVDRIAVVGTPGCNRAEQLPGLLGEARHRQPSGRGGVGGEHTGASCIADDAKAIASWQRLADEHLGHVEEFRQRLRLEHTGLGEQRPYRGVGVGGGRRVRGARATATGRPASLDHEHRLAPAHPAG